jgi:hypothetical protein
MFQTEVLCDVISKLTLQSVEDSEHINTVKSQFKVSFENGGFE